MRRNYSLSMRLTADGRQARRELIGVGRTAEQTATRAGQAMTRMAGRAAHGGAAAGVGVRTTADRLGLRGFGSDLSRMMGFDRIGKDMQSGLGRALSWTSAAFGAFGKTAMATTRLLTSGIRIAGRVIRSAFTIPLRAATAGFKALGVAAAGAVAGVYAGAKAIEPAAEMEQYSLQLRVMLGNAEAAGKRLQELAKYAKETNFSMRQIVEAGNFMEALGFYSQRNLSLVGDAANAFGKDIKEIIYSLNFLASGRGGEAFRSLATIGITREKLKPYGVEFTRSGEMLTEGKDAMNAVLRYFEDRFGGMTEEQARTWRGSIQQMGGEIYYAFARGFRRALTPLRQFVQGRAIPLIEEIGTRLEKIDWRKILATPLRLLGGLSELARQGLAGDTAGIRELTGGIWQGAKDIIRGLPAVGVAFLQDMARTGEMFLGSGGMGKVLTAGAELLKLSFEFGAQLLSRVLMGFSREFQSDLRIALEALPIPGIGRTETERRAAAEDSAARAVRAALIGDDAGSRELLRFHRGWMQQERSLGDLAFGGDWEARRRRSSAQHMIRQPGRVGEVARRAYESVMRREMGWDFEESSPFYRDPGYWKRRKGAALGALGGISIDPQTIQTRGAVAELKAIAKETKDAAGRVLSDADRRSSVAWQAEHRIRELERRRASIADDAHLRKLYRTGWDASGRPRALYGTAAEIGRRQHAQEQYPWLRAQQRRRIGDIDAEILRLRRVQAEARRGKLPGVEAGAVKIGGESVGAKQVEQGTKPLADGVENLVLSSGQQRLALVAVQREIVNMSALLHKVLEV